MMRAGDRGQTPNGIPARPLVAIGIVALAAWAAVAGAQAVTTASELSIKAAYLFRFAAYVEWPDESFADPDTPLTIAVFGSAKLADELRAITARRTVHGRDVAVRRIGESQSLDGVHIVFAGDADGEQLDRLAAEARKHAALLVTDAGDALDRGSVINFRAMDQRIRFEISLDAADTNRLRLSSRLLAVAEHVRPRSQ